MHAHWLTRINLGLSIVSGTCFFLALVFVLWGRPDVSTPEIKKGVLTLPKGAYVQSPENYAALGRDLFTLNFVPLSLQLPDLRHHISFYGKNGRPDMVSGQNIFFMGLRAPKTSVPVVFSTEPGVYNYLVYKSGSSGGAYERSEDNQPTPLWIMVEADDEEARITVGMQSPAGEELTAPREHRTFTLQQVRRPRSRKEQWKVGQFRADPSLLVRQKARWYGKDVFMREHGGEEYHRLADAERVDFGEKGSTYAHFLLEGDMLVWKEEKWHAFSGVEDSTRYPLLRLDKVEDRVLRFTLWNEGGELVVPISLVRAREMWRLRNLDQTLRFVGVRTRTQFIVEMQGQRKILSTYDWFLHDEGTWSKLDSAEEIRAYVDRGKLGELLVIDGLDQRDGRDVLKAHVFNQSRTEIYELQLSTASTEMIQGKEPPEDEPETEPEPQRDVEVEKPQKVVPGERRIPKDKEERLRRLRERREQMRREYEENMDEMEGGSSDLDDWRVRRKRRISPVIRGQG